MGVRIYFVIQIFYKFTTCKLVFTESNTMAKSLRSKWKRKMRAVKRVRYGEKENKVLEKILKNSDERKKLLENVTETCKMPRCNIGNCTLKIKYTITESSGKYAHGVSKRVSAKSR